MKQALSSVSRQVPLTRGCLLVALFASVFLGTATQAYAANNVLSFGATNHIVTTTGKITAADFTAE